MDMSEELTQKSHMEAILRPDSTEPFETFMSHLMEKRSEAESMFNLMKHQDPNSLALKLAEFLGSSKYIESREKYAVLLSKLLAEDDLAAFLYQRITDSSSSNKLKKSAFLIFSQLAKDIGQTVVPGSKDLRSIFRNTLNDDTVDCDVRIGATNAVISFIQCISSSNEKEIFQELLPGMMGTLTDAILISSGKAKEVLKLLIELAENDPRFLRRQLVDVVGSMFEIAEDESLEEGTRHLAVEVLLTLVEAKKRAPGMIKRIPLFINRCFAVLLKFFLDFNKDDPAWHTAHLPISLVEQSGISPNGRRCLTRFSVALGGKSIAHTAKEQLFDYLDAPEWEKRHAALIALTCICSAKGCSEGMSKNLEQLVSMVLNCFQDPYPRVRWAACCAIAGMSAAMKPDLQDQCHNEVFPALAATLDDFQNPPMQDCGMKAFCHFSLPCKPEYLIPYLDDIVSKLLVLLQSDKHMFQPGALSSLAYVADCVKEHLGTYYDTIMSQLITVLRNAELESNFILRAAAMECISIFWRSVGLEKFNKDTKQVMDILMSVEKLQVKTEDTTTTRMLTACGNFCEFMGKDFLPYIGTILPFFIQCAQLEPVMTISKAERYENYIFDDSIESIANLREKKNVLRTKNYACYHLRSSIKVLKEELYQWIPQLFSVFVPLLKFYTDNTVRKHAARAMAILLRTAKRAVKKGIAQGGSESYFEKLSGDVMMSMVEALREEPETEVCVLILDKLNRCLQICGPSLITRDHVSSIVNELKHVITKSSSRKQELAERAKLEDFDAEEEELLREEREKEGNIDRKVGKILCTLIDDFNGAFLPFLDEWSSYLLPMWAKEKTTSERDTTMCIFVELLAGEWHELALKYYDAYLPLILDAINDEVPSVRKNALYGLELWAQYDSFIPFVGAALSRINVVITHINALEPANVNAYVRAVLALGKICEYHGKSIDLPQVIPAWLNCLPVNGDNDESGLIHEQLCLMAERYDKELLGPNYRYLPKVISIFAEVLCSKEDEGSEEDEGLEEDERLQEDEGLEEDEHLLEDEGLEEDEGSEEDEGLEEDECLQEDEGSEDDERSEESEKDEGLEEAVGSEEDEGLEEDERLQEDEGLEEDEHSEESEKDEGSKKDEGLEEDEGLEVDEGSEEDEEITDRIIDVLRHLQKILPPNTLESACSYVLPQHQMVLKSYLQGRSQSTIMGFGRTP